MASYQSNFMKSYGMVVKTILKMYEVFMRNSTKLKDVHLLLAKSGEEGQKLLKTNHVDLIILDWKLPRMSGLEFLQELRKSELNKNTKVIMSTSVNDKSNIVKVASLGISGYLVKPIMAKSFMEKVGSELGL